MLPPVHVLERLSVLTKSDSSESRGLYAKDSAASGEQDINPYLCSPFEPDRLCAGAKVSSQCTVLGRAV